jgi:hypothetical protein
MNLRKHLAGLTLFLIIFSGTVFIFNYLTAPTGAVPARHLIPLQSPPLAPPPQPATPLELSYEVQYVSLDFINRQSYTTLAVHLEAGRPAPAKLWVRTYFFAPGDARRRVWSGEATEVLVPSVEGERLEIVSVASCDWSTDSTAPEAGYYARVVVSNRSADDTYLPDFEINREIATATPVVVQAERKSSR